ncbi:MAG: bacterioferritin [Caulobacterales bacterium 32-69-10]|nr:MAG: bacterioferritin [Caulobacterales bacterium 32-69-10]
MRGDPNIIALLNTCLKVELTATDQYLLHGEMYRDWGFRRLGDMVIAESAEEREHGRSLIQRILFLEGRPNMADRFDLRIAATVPEGLANDLALEIEGRRILVDGVQQCEAARDYVSRELLVHLLKDTEDHIDFLETQVSLVGSLGEPNYLQSAMGELSKDSGAA